MSSTEEVYELRRRIPKALDIHNEERKIEDVKANEKIWTCIHCGQPLTLHRPRRYPPYWAHNPKSNDCVLKTNIFTHKTVDNIKKLDHMIMEMTNANPNTEKKIIVKCTIYKIVEIAGHYVRDCYDLVPKEVTKEITKEEPKNIPLSDLREEDREIIINNNYTKIAEAVKEHKGLFLELEGEIYDIDHPGITVEIHFTDVEKEMIRLFYYGTDYLKNYFSKDLIINSVAAYMKDKHVRLWLQEYVINRLKSLERTHDSVPNNELSRAEAWRFISMLINETIGEHDFEIKNMHLHFSLYEKLKEHDNYGNTCFRFHIDYIYVGDLKIQFSAYYNHDKKPLHPDPSKSYGFCITCGFSNFKTIFKGNEYLKLYKENGTVMKKIDKPKLPAKTNTLAYYFDSDEENVLPFYVIRSLYNKDVCYFNVLKHNNVFNAVYYNGVEEMKRR